MSKDKILQEAFPESMFNVRNPMTGQVNIDQLEQAVKEKTNSLIDSTKISEIPSIIKNGLLEKLIPTIPTIELPSPAEIVEFANSRILLAKRKAQEQCIAQLTTAALKENKPFTSRQQMVNLTSRKNSRG